MLLIPQREKGMRRELFIQPAHSEPKSRLQKNKKMFIQYFFGIFVNVTITRNGDFDTIDATREAVGLLPTVSVSARRANGDEDSSSSEVFDVSELARQEVCD
jgi:hypothetical protein